MIPALRAAINAIESALYTSRQRTKPNVDRWQIKPRQYSIISNSAQSKHPSQILREAFDLADCCTAAQVHLGQMLVERFV